MGSGWKPKGRVFFRRNSCFMKHVYWISDFCLHNSRQEIIIWSYSPNFQIKAFPCWLSFNSAHIFHENISTITMAAATVHICIMSPITLSPAATVHICIMSPIRLPPAATVHICIMSPITLSPAATVHICLWAQLHYHQLLQFTYVLWAQFAWDTIIYEFLSVYN